MMVQTILRRPDVERATGLPRSTIYELISNGRFPKPVSLGTRSVGWLETEVAAWQKEQIARRDRKRSQSGAGEHEP
jgi:prophage regulatory protein